MRSPAQHPTRLARDVGGLELDLGLAPPSQPRPAASAPASGRRPSPATPPAAAGGGPASGRRQAPPVPAALGADDEIELGSDLEVSGSGPAAATLGGGDSAWDEDHDALEVGLDLGSVRPPAPAAPGSAPEKPVKSRAATTGGNAAAAAAAAAAAPPEPLASRPSGRGAATAQTPGAAAAGPGTLSADDYEVKALAQYGPVPEPIWAAPKYAWRVYQRRQELRKQLVQQESFHEQAQKAVREKLAAEVDAIAERHDSDELSMILAPIDDAEQMFGQRRAQIDAAAGQFAAQFADIDKQLAAEQEVRKQRVRDREMAQIQVEDAVQKHARVTGEVKRLEAMIAAAHEQAQKAAGGADFAPPEHARKIAALEAQKGKVATQLEARERALAEAKTALRERAAELRAVDDRVRAIHARTNQTEEQAGEARQLAIEGMKQAHQRRLQAYETALERICIERPDLVDEATQARIDQLKKDLAEVDVDLERHRLAIDAYDKPTFQKGVGLVAAAAVLLLVLLVSLARVG